MFFLLSRANIYEPRPGEVRPGASTSNEVRLAVRHLSESHFRFLRRLAGHAR